MTFAYDPPIVSDYLVVRLDVFEDKLHEFEQGMRETLPHWEDPASLKWKLEVAAKSTAVLDGKRGYLHIWQTPTPMNLWEAMYMIAAKSSYATLHKAIAREEQDIMRFSAQYAPSVVPHKPMFALQEVQLVQDWFHVQGWQFGLAQLARNHQAGPSGWELALALQSQTGRLRRHLQLWAFEQGGEAPADRADWEKVDPQRPADSAIRLGQPEGVQAVLSRTKFAVYTAVNYRPRPS